MDILFNRQSLFLLVPTVFLFSPTSSIIRIMQTSGSIRKTNEKKLVPFFYFMFRYIEDALSLHNLMATSITLKLIYKLQQIDQGLF